MAGVLLGLAPIAETALADCAGVPGPCEIDGGSYHIVLPHDRGGAIPAMLWLHGAGGNGASATRAGGLARTFLDRGWAVIGANGLPRPGGNRGSWNFRGPDPDRRDEIAFLTAVTEDAATRFGIDPDRVLLAGFSIGGSMASYVACRAPETFWAYAPIGGGFWRPHPEACAGPVRLFHTHGWTDVTVPLEGRPLRDGAIYQGDIFVTLAMWREMNGCDLLRPDDIIADGPFWRRRWTACDPDTALEFALFPRGHEIPRGWSAMILDWAEELP